jgi:ankyrin repeat protein
MTSSSLDEQLVQATIDLDIPKMESALQQGANPNTFIERNRLKSPLEIIAGEYFGKNDALAKQAASLLLAHGANLNGNGSVMKPFHLAVAQDAFSLVELFIQHGQDIQQKGHEDTTALHLAAKGFTSPKMAELLIAAGANIDAQDDKGKTPAHYLRRSWPNETQQIEVLKMLVAKGADLTIRDKGNHTYLSLIEYNPVFKKGLIDALIENHAKLKDNVLVNQVIQQLSDYNISTIEDLAEPENSHAKMAIMNSIIYGHVATLYPDHLLEYELHQATSSQHIDLTKINSLLEHGADPNFKDFSLFTKDEQVSALSALTQKYGCSEQRLAAMKLLLTHGADPNEVNALGNSPLHDVAHSASPYTACPNKFAKILFEHGANPNLQNDIGNTPAHHLMEQFKLPADWSARANGDPSLKNLFAMAKDFKQHEADFKLPNHDGKTPIDMAGKHASIKISDVFLDMSNDVIDLESCFTTPSNQLTLQQTAENTLHAVLPNSISEFFNIQHHEILC